MPDVFIPGGVVSFVGVYKPGDPPPTGYVDKSEWAKVQLRAGLKQKRCGICSKWQFPQELSDQTVQVTSEDRRGRKRRTTSPVCLSCCKSQKS